MGTHEDWLAAKERRDDAAVLLSMAFTFGNMNRAREYGKKFTAAQAEMTQIARELDGRGSK